MPPKKLQSKRKRQKNEPSASQPQPKFLLSNQEYAKERRKRFDQMTILNHQYLDWGVLKEYGLVERIQQTVVDKTWFKLFEIKEPAYRDVTIEFLSTVKIEKDRFATMSFQAFEEVHYVDLNQIGYFLGFHTNPEPEEELTNSWPEDMSAERMWSQMIHPKQEDFIPSKSLASSFSAVEHKLLHHILAHTISCKKTSHSKVTSFDMFYLFSMISGYNIDLGIEVANFIYRQVEDTRTQFILCGGYITALLKGMGIFREPDDDDEGIDCKRISSAPFRGWGLTKVTNRADPLIHEEGIHEVPPTERPSGSSSIPPNSSYEQLRTDIKGIKKQVHKERKKNKKFRTTLVNMLKSAISCFHPAAAEHLNYETSSEASSSSEPDS